MFLEFSGTSEQLRDNKTVYRSFLGHIFSKTIALYRLVGGLNEKVKQAMPDYTDEKAATYKDTLSIIVKDKIDTIFAQPEVSLYHDFLYKLSDNLFKYDYKECFNQLLDADVFLSCVSQQEISDPYNSRCTENDFASYCAYRNLSIPQANILFISDEVDVRRTLLSHSSEPMRKNMDEASELMRKYKPYRSYEINNLLDVCLASINEICRQGRTIKRCENCGRYFVPKRSDARFCDEYVPGKDISCRLQMKNKPIQIEQSENAKGLYEQIYNEKLERMEKHAENFDYRVEFETFIRDAREWQKKVNRNQCTDNDYISWLQNQNEH